MPDRDKDRIYERDCEIIDDDGAKSNRRLTDEIVDSIDCGRIGKAIGNRVGDVVKKGLHGVLDKAADSISKRRKK